MCSDVMFSYIISQKLYTAISGEYKNPHGVTEGQGGWGRAESKTYTRRKRQTRFIYTCPPSVNAIILSHMDSYTNRYRNYNAIIF